MMLYLSIECARTLLTFVRNGHHRRGGTEYRLVVGRWPHSKQGGMVPKKCYLIRALLLLALAGCSGREHEAKEAIRRILLDPESGQFTDVFVNKQNDAVCGMVNGKNRFGAYAGSLPFMYHTAGDQKRAFILSVPSDEEFETHALSVRSWNNNSDDLFQRCRELPEWESACGRKVTLARSPRYCGMVNGGAGNLQVFEMLLKEQRRY
jgi:hypothetical protein